MKAKQDVESLIKKIKFATGLNQDGIAKAVNYSREHVSRAKKANDPEFYNLLLKTFKDQIGDTPPPTGKEITLDDRALIKALLFEVANLKAEKEGVTFDEALDSIKKNTNLVKAGF